LRKMRRRLPSLRVVLKTAGFLLQVWIREQVLGELSFNGLMKGPETIRQTVAYPRESKSIFGTDKWSPPLFICCNPTATWSNMGF